MTSVFEEWSISNRDVIAFIADNGANMVKSGEYLTNEQDISFFRCSAHTLQLAIKDTLKSNEYIQNCISQSRSFVTAIHTSYILMRRYKEICIEKNERCRKLNSDVSTRWNSTYYMLEQVMSMRKVLIQLYAENEKQLPFESIETWDILNDVVQILAPVKESSIIFEGEKTSYISELIPTIRGLLDYLQVVFVNENNSDQNHIELKTSLGQTFRNHLISNIQHRFKDYISLPNEIKEEINQSIFNLNQISIPYIATALDIRYKACLELNDDERKVVKMMLYKLIEWNTLPQIEPILNLKNRILNRSSSGSNQSHELSRYSSIFPIADIDPLD